MVKVNKKKSSNSNTAMCRCLVVFACAVATWLLPLPAVFAQVSPADIPAAPRFDITRVAVDGNTLLKPEDIERVFAPYVGKQKDFSDIQRALEALEEAYRNRGYGVVQVLLPEQDITRGVVQLRVIEPRLSIVTVEGNKHFNEANIRNSLPGLQVGASPNSQQIARNLQLLAEHPAKQTTVLLRAGATEGQIDAAVKVEDEKPLKFAVTLDNSGTSTTGRYRVGIGMQHSNLFNRDHILNLQYITNPEDPSKVSIYGAGYRIPFYSHNSSLDVFAGYSDVDSGTLQGLFNVSGSGTVFGGRYNLHLAKIGQYEHKLSFGLDYRAYENNVTLLGGGGGTLVPDVTVHPASITYNGLWRLTNSEFGFYASYSRNIPGGNHGRSSDFRLARDGASADYSILRGGLNYSRVFAADWQFRAVLNAQYTDDALVPGEQFGYGGADSVRGFNSREVANDSGYSGSFEVYTPELGSKFGWRWTDLKARLLAFYDYGDTDRNKGQLGAQPPGESGSSAGVGLRLAYGKLLSLRLDFAQVLDAAGTQRKNDHKVHGSVAVVF